tara:strand:+ start:420 stop:629 length:210 start_codon:yes stop_codon:yes gene_type:complete
MYDHINVGDLVYLKRKINLCKDKTEDTCLVLYKEKLDNDFLFNLLFKNQIVVYDTTILNRNISLELLNN